MDWDTSIKDVGNATGKMNRVISVDIRVFSIQGLCRLKTRVKPATKAGVRNIFGKEVKCAAKPARTIVKAFPVAALKAQI